MIECRQCGRQNSDGARFCANPDCEAYLGWEGQRRERPAPAPAPPGPRPGPPPPGPPRPGPPPGAETQAAAGTVTLAQASLAVDPGESVVTTATVYNGGTQVEQFVLAVVGPA